MKKVYYIALALFVIGFILIAAGYLLPAVLVLWVSFIALGVVYCATKKKPKNSNPKTPSENSNNYAATTWWYLNNN